MYVIYMYVYECNIPWISVPVLHLAIFSAKEDNSFETIPRTPFWKLADLFPH